jgi:hypothetical protein
VSELEIVKTSDGVNESIKVKSAEAEDVLNVSNSEKADEASNRVDMRKDEETGISYETNSKPEGSSAEAIIGTETEN